ncbi:MAG: LysM peptidoglycan-binding domain-containing protein [Sphingobacteriales bacterium]|nr:MAG: LysM peptidoglycan-binding domain-containing protein [Sphingobacteriales bacterium]
MHQRRIACIILMLCAGLRGGAQERYSDRALKYIESYKEWAIEEQRRSGVPASITLAQGIHETSGGQSELAANANNHFGIKCKKDWKGESYSYTDDAPNECFRKYPSALQSYKDHSDYLRTNPRYARLFALDVTDYKGWASGLKACGYATNPKYAAILIRIIEEYKLQEHTVAALTDAPQIVPSEKYKSEPKIATIRSNEIVPEQDKPVVSASVATPPVARKIMVSYGTETPKAVQQQERTPSQPTDNTAPEYGKLTRVNDLKAFYAKKGTMLLQDAMVHNIRYAKLLELNDLADAPLEADMYIYLEKKHTTGDKATHVVRPGETLSQIAQMQGVQLKYLKAYNKIGGNEEPMEGAVLQLLDYVTVKPPTYAKVVAPAEVAAKQSVAAAPVQSNAGAGYILRSEIEKGKLRDDIADKLTMPKTDLIEKIPQQGKKLLEAVAVASESLAVTGRSREISVPIAEAEKLEPMEPVNQPTVASNDTSDVNSVSPEAAPEAPAEIIAAENVTPEVLVKESGAPMMAEIKAAEQVPTNIADEPAVEELIKQAHQEAHQEPEDAFARLKSRLDKVVYASDKASQSKSAEAKPPVSDNTLKNEAAKFYTVKKGDTAFGIARMHKLSMRQLMDLNKLDFQAVKPGQQLRVK